jgi:hypothetical protein
VAPARATRPGRVRPGSRARARGRQELRKLGRGSFVAKYPTRLRPCPRRAARAPARGARAPPPPPLAAAAPAPRLAAARRRVAWAPGACCSSAPSDAGRSQSARHPPAVPAVRCGAGQGGCPVALSPRGTQRPLPSPQSRRPLGSEACLPELPCIHAARGHTGGRRWGEGAVPTWAGGGGAGAPPARARARSPHAPRPAEAAGAAGPGRARGGGAARSQFAKIIFRRRARRAGGARARLAGPKAPSRGRTAGRRDRGRALGREATGPQRGEQSRERRWCGATIRAKDR